MLKSYRCIICLSVIPLVLGGCVQQATQSSLPTPPPPKIECRQILGAWCLRENAARDVSVRYIPEDGVFMWQITDPRWDGEVLDIIEPQSCRNEPGERAGFQNLGVIAGEDGIERQKLNFSLRDDGSCTLEVTLENNGSVSYGWSYAFSLIAICLPGADCADSPIGSHRPQELTDLIRRRLFISR